MKRVLLVDTDPETAAAVRSVTEAESLELFLAASLTEARAAVSEARPGLILAALELEDGEGLQLLSEIDQGIDLALILGEHASETALEILRQGAVDCLSRPIDVARLGALLRGYSRAAELRDEVSDLRRQLRGVGRLGPMIGDSSAMERVFELAEQVAPTEATVLVTGESGTGKELVAQTVHQLSRRRRKEILAVNCGAISPNLIESELFGHERGAFTGADRRHEGYFERADGSTLFLDEITEMPIELQVKLLRVLETGQVRRVGGNQSLDVDVRVVAASNRDPVEAVEQGDLREDLYYRLRVFPIHLPPLRERDEDIELLARHFLTRCNRREGARTRLTDEAIDTLVAYAWPGNVRELENAIERAFILAGDRVTRENLPREVRMNLEGPVGGPYVQIRIGESLAEAERRLILATLEEFDDRRKETAEALGISQKTLYNRLKSYREAQENEGPP